MNRLYVQAMAIAICGLYTAQSFARSGDTRGNGGDLITCRTTNGAIYTGDYVLDYLVRASATEGSDQVLGVEAIDAGMGATLIFRERGLLELSRSFEQFLSDAFLQLYSTPDYRRPYIWRKAVLGLTNIKDEQLFTVIPQNCHKNDSSDIIQLQQIVIRQTMPGANGIVLDYDSTQLEKIQDRPYQLSFLLTHEWLWQFVTNAESIRNINWYLHTKNFANDTAEEILFALANMGFKFNAHAKVRDPSSKITFDNRIELKYTEHVNPNNRREFRVNSFLVVSPDAKVINFVAPGPEKFDVFEVDNNGNRIPLCHEVINCNIKLLPKSQFPKVLGIERQYMQDPIWDSARVNIFN